VVDQDRNEHRSNELDSFCIIAKPIKLAFPCALLERAGGHQLAP
jgi:hypothetical protein